MKYLIAVLIVAIFIIIFFVTYILNKKTPVPKGCEDLNDLKSKCAGCTNESCSFKKKEEASNE